MSDERVDGNGYLGNLRGELHEMYWCSGTQFELDVLDAFVKSIQTGDNFRLYDNWLARSQLDTIEVGHAGAKE
jgi:hypothetical protein